MKAKHFKIQAARILAQAYSDIEKLAIESGYDNLIDDEGDHIDFERAVSNGIKEDFDHELFFAMDGINRLSDPQVDVQQLENTFAAVDVCLEKAVGEDETTENRSMAQFWQR